MNLIYSIFDHMCLVGTTSPSEFDYHNLISVTLGKILNHNNRILINYEKIDLISSACIFVAFCNGI